MHDSDYYLQRILLMILWDFVRVCNEVRHFSEKVLFLDTTSVCWKGLQFLSMIWFYSEPSEGEIQRSSQDASIMDRGGNLPLLVGSALEGELSSYFLQKLSAAERRNSSPCWL